MSDFYVTLGVDRGATQDEIKKKYRKLALKFHPDKNPGNQDAEQKFKEAAEAYDILGDPDKRARYDQFGEAGVRNGGAPGGFDFDSSDALRTFMSGFGNFGGFADLFGGGRRSRQQSFRGSDLRATLPLTYEEIATGAEKTIRLKRFATCPSCEGSGAAEGGGLVACPACHGAGEIRQVQRSLMGQIVNVTQCRNCMGTGQVVDRPCRFCHGEGRTKQSRDIKIKVPPGVASGNYMTLEGEGNRGPRGAPPGDLLVLFEEKPHPIFTRHGNNVLLDVNISFAEAALGMSLEVPTLEGKAKLKFPASIQSGHILRMRGKGFPGLHHRGKGDQLVRIQVMSPTMVSAAQQKIFRQLQKAEKAISPRERFSRYSEQ